MPSIRAENPGYQIHVPAPTGSFQGIGRLYLSDTFDIYSFTWKRPSRINKGFSFPCVNTWRKAALPVSWTGPTRKGRRSAAIRKVRRLQYACNRNGKAGHGMPARRLTPTLLGHVTNVLLPVNALDRLAKNFGNCLPISSTRVHGDWVCLQNCHLAESFMPDLQQLYDRLHQQQVNPAFRLFLTCQPTNILPTSLVRQSIKITAEQPSVGFSKLVVLHTHGSQLR